MAANNHFSMSSIGSTGSLPELTRSSMSRKSPKPKSELDWNLAKPILRLPASEELLQENALEHITMEKLMLFEDRPFVYLGDVATLVVGIWFPAKYSEQEVMAAIAPLDGMLVTLEAKHSEAWKQADLTDHPLRSWLHPPSEREKLRIIEKSPWTLMKAEGIKSEKQLFARTARVHVKSRYLSPTTEDRKLFVTLREIGTQASGRDLDVVLKDSISAPSTLTLAHRNLEKLVQMKAPVTFEETRNITNGKTFIGITAENQRPDCEIIILPPVFHTIASCVTTKAHGSVPGRTEADTDGASQRYVLRPMFKSMNTSITWAEDDWENWDEHIFKGPATCLQPGEIFSFVYSVEALPGAVPLEPDRVFRTPTSVPWCASTATKDCKRLLSREEMSNSVLEMTWSSPGVTAEFTLNFSAPEKARAGEQFNIEVVAKNNSSKDVERAVLTIQRGSMLPLRSKINLDKIPANSSTTVNLPCIAFNYGVVHLERVSITDRNSNTWTSNRPFEVFIHAAHSQNLEKLEEQVSSLAV